MQIINFRLEGVTRSPVFSHITATLNGLSTIRACGAQEMLKKEFDTHQDVHSGTWYCIFLTQFLQTLKYVLMFHFIFRYISIATNTAFGLWLSVFCCLFVAVVTFTFLIMGRGIYIFHIHR